MTLTHSCPEPDCDFGCNSKKCLINHKIVNHYCPSCIRGSFDRLDKSCIECYRKLKKRLEKE